MEIQTAPPTPNSVSVESSEWTSEFLNAVGQFGYQIPTGENQLAPLPWTGLDTIHVKFTETEEVGELQASDVQLAGVNRRSYAISDFAYDTTTRRATIRLEEPIQRDKISLLIRGVSDPETEGDFEFRFNVLPGDINQSGGVAVTDIGGLRMGLGREFGDPQYSIFADLDGSGAIAVSDVVHLRNNLGLSLPIAEPVFAVAVLPVPATESRAPHENAMFGLDSVDPKHVESRARRWDAAFADDFRRAAV